MADDLIKELENKVRLQNQILVQIKALTEAGEAETEGCKKLVVEYKNLTDNIQNIIKDNKELQSVYDKLTTREVIKDFSNLTKTLGGVGGGFKETIGQFSNFGQAIKENADLAVMFNDKARKMIDVSKGFDLISSAKVFGEINQSINLLLPVQTTARETFTSFGDSIEVANEKASKYPETLINMSSAFGVTTKDLNEFNQSVKDVPGSLDSVKGSIFGITSLQGTFAQTGAVLLTTLRGLGKTSSESAEFINTSFKSFGRSAEGVTKIVGEMAEASKDSGLSSNFVSKSIMEASSGLGIFGEKASLATNVWKTFSTGLKDSGVAVNSINAMVGDLVKGISSMTTENKAFVGMMGGMMRGSSALGGALKMEMNMRSEGGLEKTVQMLTSTLSSFAGGKIINLEQATTNPQLENLFILQRQTLGKLTGITSAEQQNRVLEVLQGVQQGGISQVQGSKALQEVFEKGENIQERQVTSIERIEQILRSTLVGASIQKITNLDQVLRGKGVENLSRATMTGGEEQQDLYKSGTRDLISELGMASEKISNFNNLVSPEDNRRKASLQSIFNSNRDVSDVGEPTPMESSRTPHFAVSNPNLLTSSSAQSKIVNWPRPQQDTAALQEDSYENKKRVSVSSSDSTLVIKIQNDDEALNKLMGKIKTVLGEIIPSVMMGKHK